jgi:hypothetical protein
MPRATPKKRKKVSKRRPQYLAPRIAREPREGLSPERLFRAWRRVLERRLRARMRERVVLELHDNTHTMITYQRFRGWWRVRLHHMFLAAPEPVMSSLIEFVRGTSSDSSSVLDRFIEENKSLIRKIPAAELRKKLRIDPKGDHHDLARIFERLNARYFDNRVRVTITYGDYPRTRRPRKSIRMGSYSADSKIIRIHPALDQSHVPSYFVEWIVFHEMLHHIHRARRDANGRRCVHTPEFLEHEQKFHSIKRAQAWENDNLESLLRSRFA